MGAAAAYDVSVRMRQMAGDKHALRMVFAAAPSQNEFLQALRLTNDLDWQRVAAFHMDEYIGLPADAPQGFGFFLRERLLGRVPFGRVEYIDGNAQDVSAECERYAGLLAESPLDIVCAGIGENGHMAFNDPHVADFADPKLVKTVTLDDVCRLQQVHDGAFATLDDVPKMAMTMTMPALMSAAHVCCVVPASTKAEAVRNTLQGPIGEDCPATIMRRHADAVLYLDEDAAALV